MNTEPNWLDLEDELYPESYLPKLLQVEGGSFGAAIHYPIHVAYNWLHRQINMTTALQELIEKCNKLPNIDFHHDETYNIFLLDLQDEAFKFVGSYPLKESILLKGRFVQAENLVVRLEKANAEPKPKPKTEKTLRVVLQKVAQWRKIHLEKKVTFEEAAAMMGIPKNTLDDYYSQIKVAEKLGYNFHQRLDEPFQELRKFVKTEEEKKEKPKSWNPVPHILSKYQPK